MNVQEELASAALWLKTLSEEEQNGLRALALQLTEAMCHETVPVTVLQKLGQEIQKGLGSVREYINEETIEKTVYENILCVLFRLHTFVANRNRWEKLDGILLLLDRFFQYFGLFVDNTVSRKPHPSFSDDDMHILCRRAVSFFLSLAFPEKENSFLIPLPSFLLGMAKPYMKRVYDELEAKGASLLLSVITTPSLRAALFFQAASLLHKKVCGWKGELSSLGPIQEKELELRREALESIIEKATLCLTKNGEKLASLCPKYQLSGVGIVFLDEMNKRMASTAVSFVLQGLHQFLHMPLKKDERMPSSMLEALEKQFLNKNSYAPLYYRLVRKQKSVPSLSRGPFFLQVLFQGFLGGLLEQSFESLPWDEFFSLLDFALRRSWYYSLSTEAVLCLKDIPVGSKA